MTPREQLAKQASIPRPRFVHAVKSFLDPSPIGLATLEMDREIYLAAEMRDPSRLGPLKAGDVNASEVCGIPAGHLAIESIAVEMLDMTNLTAETKYLVRIDLIDSPTPLRGSSAVDFDALLDVLEDDDPPPSQVLSWREQPRLL
jgi:hypothetical protein